MLRRLLSTSSLTKSLMAISLGLGLHVISATSFPALAQDRATLISDSLSISGDSQLIASGHVEAFYGGNRLSAARIIYDQAADRLTIEGPLRLTDADGRTVILASHAELDADMQEGLMQSARLVLDEQLQMAASNLARIGGRYTAMDQVVASSCQICAANPTPLWEIRARRVIHDGLEDQIYFDHAQFRLAGVPVFYLPRLRMPGPGLDRASGFLSPEFISTSELGSGFKVPYFIAISDDKDLTVTPFMTTKDSATLELRYRQAFRTGQIEINGAITDDKLTEKDKRGYLFAQGSFDLPDSLKLTFALQVASDNAYLLDYDYSDADRLDSRIEISRVRRNGFISGRVVSFQSLRDEDDNDTLPSLVTDLTFHRRFSLGPIGGEGGLRLQAHKHWRTSSNPFDSALDPDDIADGRDLSRISARVDWRKSYILDGGIEATVLGEAQSDIYRINQDAEYAGTMTRNHAAAGVELRWPWVKAAEGATHVIEPIAQIVWAGRHSRNIPNEDSTLIEFDEGNLFALDRFPGSDAVEEGTRANLGLSWTRHDVDGWSLSTMVGRVWRDGEENQFGQASGLAGKRSDWLAAMTLDWQNGLAASGRLVFDGNFEISKAEMRLAMNQDRLAVSTSALWAEADLLENRPERTREIRFDGAWQATPAISASFKGNYDFESERGTLAGLGVEFRNECLAVDVSLSRRFTSSTSVTPTTSFGLSVDLIGFGSGKTAGPSRRCY